MQRRCCGENFLMAQIGSHQVLTDSMLQQVVKSSLRYIVAAHNQAQK